MAQTQFLINRSLSASFTQALPDVEDQADLQFTYTVEAGLTGTFTIEGSVDGINSWTTLPFNIGSSSVTSFSIPATASPVFVTFTGGTGLHLRVNYTVGVTGAGFVNGYITTYENTNITFPAVQPVSQSGVWNVGVTAISGSVAVTGTVTANLGTIDGAATEVTLAALNTKVPANLTVTSTRLLVDGSGVTQPVSIAGSVAVTGPLTDTQLRASAVPVSLASTTVTGTVAVNQTQMNGVAVLAGNGITGTGSQRVTIASDNTAFTVNAAQSGTWNINNISGTISLPTGASTSALQTTGNTSLASIKTNTDNLSLAQSSTTAGQSGSLTLAAVTTAAPTYTTAQTNPLSLTTGGALRSDISSYGGTATTIGQKVSASSIPVVIASDQTITVTNSTPSPVRSATATQTTVAVTTASTQVLAANANRKGFIVCNVGGNACLLSFGTAPTSAIFGLSINNTTGADKYEMLTNVYTGAINCIRGSGSTNVVVTEFT